MAEGKKLHARIILQEISPTLQSYRSDLSEDGRAWTTVLEGEMRKL